MKYSAILSQSNYMIVNKKIAKSLGLINSILISNLCSLEEKYGEGFFFTQEEMAETCCVCLDTIKKGLSFLKKEGYIEIKKKGIPCKNYYYFTDYFEKYIKDLLIEDNTIKIDENNSNKLVEMSTNKEDDNNTNNINNTINNNNKESTNVDKKDEIDFDIVLSKWSEYCPMLSKPRMIDNKRKKMIISLLKNNEATIDDMFKCFKIMANSQVCNGDGGTWKASFDWFIKNTNSCFNGLLEGKYSFKGNDNIKYKKIMDGEDMNTDSTTTENNVIEINGKIYK